MDEQGPRSGVDGPGPRAGAGAPARVYRGPDYLAAVAGGELDPHVHADPFRPPRLYRFAAALVRFLVRVLFRLRVTGLENVPEPPFIIASNHQTWYDTAFIVAAFPGLPMVYTMAGRDTAFNRAWKRAVLPRLGVFPIGRERGELDVRGVATVYQVLARRGVVLIFPEGHYSRGRALRPLRKGVAHFALQAGVPICPVAVTGQRRPLPWRPVEVSVAPPVHPEPPDWWAIQRDVEDIVDSVRASILRAFDRVSVSRSRRPSRLRRWLRRERISKGDAGQAVP